ncbi:hypothetical protein SABIM44S_00811 [Streptomyces abikoensis]
MTPQKLITDYIVEVWWTATPAGWSRTPRSTS